MQEVTREGSPILKVWANVLQLASLALFVPRPTPAGRVALFCLEHKHHQRLSFEMLNHCEAAHASCFTPMLIHLC